MKITTKFMTKGGVLATVVLMMVVLASACKSEPPAKPEKKCDTIGNFEASEVFNGYYDKYMIRLENGELISPCVVDNNTINKADVYDGMQITVSYKILQNEEIACNTATGILPGGCVVPPSARITCIDKYNPNTCGTGGYCGTKNPR